MDKFNFYLKNASTDHIKGGHNFENKYKGRIKKLLQDEHPYNCRIDTCVNF